MRPNRLPCRRVDFERALCIFFAQSGREPASPSRRPADRPGKAQGGKMGYGSHGYDGDGQDRRHRDEDDRGRYRDEVYSKRVPAGKRTYFFDVKSTRSGEDFFITITESKRLDENRYEKHKIFLYKEDFGKFVSAMHEVVRHIRDECLPDYEFRGLPELTEAPEYDDYDADHDSDR